MCFSIAARVAVMLSETTPHPIELILHMRSLALIKSATTISLAQQLL
jgi:hypothetical protein